jgi:hypothetical protein
MEIIIKTQKDLDCLPDKFKQFTVIVIKNEVDYIQITKTRENSSVEAWENSRVEARENSSVVARENSSVEAWGNSRVEARENSSVVAWENSSVVAWGNSSVVARENSSVVARGNSSVVAWENSSVEAWGNSRVEARGNSSVVARGNSSVVAWENSSVEAWGNVGVHLQSEEATITLFMFAVCWVLKQGKVKSKSKTATIIKPKYTDGASGWLDSQGVKSARKQVVLYKRVSSELKTQEKTKNETTWEIGKVITHSAWSPEKQECGAGKFHACSRPYFCDEFRNNNGDRYVAIRIKIEDLYAWQGNIIYPNKIAFRSGKVLYKCDKFGEKIDE